MAKVKANKPNENVFHKKSLVKIQDFFVGVARFELTASTSQTWRDTGLRYTPNF
jgi:hypothetical protein